MSAADSSGPVTTGLPSENPSTSGPGAERWGYSTSREAEGWTGSCDSREEAIDEAREELDLEDADAFYVIEGAIPDPANWVGDVAERVLDWVGENAYDNCGECAEDYPPDVSKEARAELNDFVRAWVRKRALPDFWMAFGVADRIDASVEEKR